MAACARAHREPAVAPEPPPVEATAEAESDEEPTPTPGQATTADGERADAGVDGVEIISFAVQAPIFSQPEWPAKDPAKTAEERHGVVRLGYLRKGEKAITKPGTIKKANCEEGWYSLAGATRGFICGKFVT